MVWTCLIAWKWFRIHFLALWKWGYASFFVLDSVQWRPNEMQLIKLRFLNNWCCNLNETKCSPRVLSGVFFMRWFTGYRVCVVLPWGGYLWICQFWTFSIIFFMEFEGGHLKEPFFLVEYHFVWSKNVAIFMSYRLSKVPILYILWHFYWK